MRAILKRAPVAAPLNRNADIFRRLLHRFGQLVVEGPVPPDDAADDRRNVDRVAGDVPRLDGLARALLDELSLTRDAADALNHLEVEIADGGSAANHFHEIRVNAAEQKFRIGAEFDRHALFLKLLRQERR